MFVAQTARQWGGLCSGPFPPLCLHSVPGEPDIHPAGCGPDHGPSPQMTHSTSAVRRPSALSGFGGGTTPPAVNPEGRKSGTDPASSFIVISFLSDFSKLSSDVFTLSTHFTCQVTLTTRLHRKPSTFGQALGVSGLESSTPDFLGTLPFGPQPFL